jgi:cytochrome c-type biogenesis protein CcmH/NrfG
MSRWIFVPAFVLLLASPIGVTTARAADTAPAPAQTESELQPARKLIAAKDWSAAVTRLEAYTRSHPTDADGFNLLGYSLRNLKRMPEAMAAYDKALGLDPRHRGAHEYIGIAYLQMGQPAKAREHLATLDKLCPFSCEEYRDLKAAIAAADKP